MKQTKSKVNIQQFRKDLEKLGDKEFEKQYPGINRKEIQKLSDSEIENVVGGASSSFGFSGPTFSRPSSYGTLDSAGLGTAPKITP